MVSIKNVGNILKSSGISNVSSRVRSIGRNVSEHVEDAAPMIGMNVARANLGLFAGLGIGGIGGATLMTKFSGWLQDQDNGFGNVGNSRGGRRFGNLSSNIGYNHIMGFNKK